MEKQTTEILSWTNKKSKTQTDGVAMGSSPEPSLANAFLFHHETKCLNYYTKYFMPVFIYYQGEVYYHA